MIRSVYWYAPKVGGSVKTNRQLVAGIFSLSKNYKSPTHSVASSAQTKTTAWYALLVVKTAGRRESIMK